MRFIQAMILMIGIHAGAAMGETFCNFTPPADAKVNLVQAFAVAAKYYGQAKDVDLIFMGCRNQEVSRKDTTYGLLAKSGLPEERVPGVGFLFIFFKEFKNGMYHFSLDETDDPWMDGYATVDAMTKDVEPKYDFERD